MMANDNVQDNVVLDVRVRLKLASNHHHHVAHTLDSCLSTEKTITLLGYSVQQKLCQWTIVQNVRTA